MQTVKYVPFGSRYRVPVTGFPLSGSRHRDLITTASPPFNVIA